MLEIHVVRAVEELLTCKTLSWRAIAKQLQISPNAVAAVACRDLTASPRYDLAGPLETGPIERCPTCGGRVYLPCRLCSVRVFQQRFYVDHRARIDGAASQPAPNERRVQPRDESLDRRQSPPW